MSGQVCEYRTFCEIRTNFVPISNQFRPICVPVAFRFAKGRCIHAPASSSGTSHTLPCVQVPFHVDSEEVRHHERKRFTPHHRLQVTGEDSEKGNGSGAGRRPSVAPSERSEGSAPSGRIVIGCIKLLADSLQHATLSSTCPAQGK